MTFAIIGDIGGTSMKLALLDASGAIRARHDGPGANLRSAITPWLVARETLAVTARLRGRSR